jgi:hypothetical protein
MSFTFQGQTFDTVADARWLAAKLAAGYSLGDKGCDWLIERREFDGMDVAEWIAECGAVLVYTDDRWECLAGHEHVSMQAREREGWDYAEDAYDAAVITQGGRAAVPMGPGTYIDPAEVEQARRAIFG